MSTPHTHEGERDMLLMEGQVVASARGDFHRVVCTVGEQTLTVLARRSGRLYQHHIAIVVGDRVRVEVSPFDLARGRIVRRL